MQILGVSIVLSILAIMVSVATLLASVMMVVNLRSSISSRLEHWEMSRGAVDADDVSPPTSSDGVPQPPLPPKPVMPEIETWTEFGKRICPTCKRKAKWDKTCDPPVAYCKCGWRSE